MFIARSFLLVPLCFLRLLLISMLTRRRNSLGAPIKRRRVETRKWSDVSQIAFLAARYLRSFRLGLFRALFFLEPHPARVCGTHDKNLVEWFIQGRSFRQCVRTCARISKIYVWNPLFYLSTTRPSAHFNSAIRLVPCWKKERDKEKKEKERTRLHLLKINHQQRFFKRFFIASPLSSKLNIYFRKLKID